MSDISKKISEASQVLIKGGVVIFPTETVYGIGANAFQRDAVEKIYRIKGRPSDNPLIIHLADIQQIQNYASAEEHLDRLQDLMPGPVTAIFPKSEAGKEIDTANLQSIAVRIPASKTALALLQECRLPIGAPSVNLSGKPSLTRIEDIEIEFANKVDCILPEFYENDNIGIESTVISFLEEKPVIVRPGFYDRTFLKKYWPEIIYSDFSSKIHAPISPGQKYRHYAPECDVVITNVLPDIISESEASLGFSIPAGKGYKIFISNNREYMQKLYAFLVDCDKLKLKKAYLQKPLEDGFSAGILDRIQKASQR